MKKQFTLLFTLLLSFVVVYSQLKKDESITYLKANLEYLASDELEGRETTKRGEDLAAMFIASELRKYGVEPFGDSGTYFQKINIEISSIDKNSTVSFSYGDKNFDLVSGRDFIIDRRGLPIEKNEIENLDVVFANYGIIAPEYEIDDYKNLDVTGKAVVVFDDMPDNDQFTRSDIRKYGTWSGKRKIAKEKGATALIMILSSDYFERWDRLSKRMFGESFSLPSTEEKEYGLPTLAFSREVFSEFFKDDIQSFEYLTDKKESGENVTPFLLNKKFGYKIFEKSWTEEAQNVVGILRGNNPKLSKTFVAVTAHYDHVGVINDVVYNGADDDGSGTVTILEAARQLAERKENDRSILFIFHTGEEKGLLGSKYLTATENYVDSIIANINMDMVGREKEDEIYCIGSAMLSKQFFNLVKEVNDRTVKFKFDYKFDDPEDPNRYYYRSDHYQYAKRGIPVVFFFDEMTEDYHKPTDDVEKINFNKLKKMSILTAEIALETANLSQRLIIDN